MCAIDLHLIKLTSILKLMAIILMNVDVAMVKYTTKGKKILCKN